MELTIRIKTSVHVPDVFPETYTTTAAPHPRAGEPLVTAIGNHVVMSEGNYIKLRGGDATLLAAVLEALNG